MKFAIYRPYTGKFYVLVSNFLAFCNWTENPEEAMQFDSEDVALTHLLKLPARYYFDLKIVSL